MPVDGSEFAVPVDTIISAVGQYSDTKLLAGVPGLVDEKENLKADVETGRTEVPGVFAAGDLLTGTDIAIRAIAGGKHAARAALAYMDGRGYQRPKEFLSKKGDFKEPVAADFKDTPRAPRARAAVMAPERGSGRLPKSNRHWRWMPRAPKRSGASSAGARTCESAR